MTINEKDRVVNGDAVLLHRMPEHEHDRGTGRRQGHIRIVVRTRDPPATYTCKRSVLSSTQYIREARLYQGLSSSPLFPLSLPSLSTSISLEPRFQCEILDRIED